MHTRTHAVLLLPLSLMLSDELLLLLPSSEDNPRFHMHWLYQSRCCSGINDNRANGRSDLTALSWRVVSQLRVPISCGNNQLHMTASHLH